MNERFTEGDFEQALIELFSEIGYSSKTGSDIERDLNDPFDRKVLYESLSHVNPRMPQEAIEEAVRIISNINDGTLEQRNEQFMEYLQNGVEVSIYEDGAPKTYIVRLISFNKHGANTMELVDQFTFVEHDKIRCDLVVFVNGLPLVVIELKSPSRSETSIEDAFKQIKQYQQKCPSLFVYNAFSVISDMTTSKAGTITSPEDRFMEWKSKDGNYESTAIADYHTFFEGIFYRTNLLDILKNFICFDHKDGKSVKVMGAYHQFFAVNKAINSIMSAAERNDGKGGVFWHTQGSGKSFSMVFLAHRLILEAPGVTLLVVTDRNDLDQQLYEQFSGCSKFLRQDAQHVGHDLNEKGKLVKSQEGGRADLKKKLKDLEQGGIIFTTIQKFEEGTGLLSERNNIVVITDEAHRSQYGDEEWDKNAQKMKKGFALLMREALPNAIFLGFTGTPISERDRDTEEVFGKCIDVYDMTQAVADGATRPVYYESRVMALNLDEEILHQLDEEFEELAEEGASEEQINKARQDHSRIDTILSNDVAIKSLCEDIVKHYEENRQYELTGKAMIVAYNKTTAVKIYKQMLQLRPSWEEKVHVVASASNIDNPEWHDIINPKNNKEYAKLFKDDSSPMKIAIVVDMWLTGFDVPSLATMYVYKPMKGHNLMQAIARVNRVFPNKEGGLIVDYIGIAQALKQAMKDYSKRDRQRFGDPDIKKTAWIKFMEKLEICRDLLHGFDYTGFYEGSNSEKAMLISGAANFLLDPKREYEMSEYRRESELLHNAETLCRSLLSKKQKQEVAFMDAVRIMVCRFTQKGKISKKEINERIATLLEQSIQSKGVVPLVIGEDVEFSLFDEAFMEEVRRMKTKNLAVELLEKLIKEQLRIYNRTNLVQSKKFSEMLSAALSNYLKGMLTNEEVIAELLKMAEEIKKAENEGNDLGLNAEEKAFYDALSTPAGVRQAYSDEEFVAMTKELTEELRKNRTIDWNKKETSRAKMRVMIKRLLKKYKYPPEGQEQALETVMAQCNQWADNEDNLNLDMAVSSPFPLDVLEFNLDDRRSCIEEHDEEMKYICSCLSNYYEDVIHAIDIGLSHSAVSHYSYNLVLILAKGLTRLVIYEYIRGAYLLEEDYDNVYKTWKSVHDSVDEIIPLLDNLEKENYFGEDINTDDFLSDILPPHCERSKGYEKLLNLHRRVSLRTGNSLVCTLRCYLRYMEQWLTDLKNGLYKDIEEDYERVFWANYKLYKQEYWPKDGKNFRNQVLSSKPRFEDFNAEYLKRCLWEERTDFFHTSPGQLWRDHSSDKKELYFGAKDIKMNESQWRYFFKCICRVEEYEKWIDELEHPVVEGKEYPESDWDKIFKDAIDVKKVKIALQKLLPKKISITTWYIIYKIFFEIDWLQDSISIHFISWVKDVYGWQYKTEDFKNSVNSELKQQHSLDWNTRTMTSAKIAKENIDFAESVRKEFVIEMNGKTVKEDNKYYFKKSELYISHPIRQ